MELWPLISAGAIIALEHLKNNDSSLSWATIQRTEFFFHKGGLSQRSFSLPEQSVLDFFFWPIVEFWRKQTPRPTPCMNFNLCSCLKLSMFPHGSRHFWLFIRKLCTRNVRPGSSRCLLCRNWLCKIWHSLKTTAVKRLLPYSFTQYYPVFSSVKSSVSLPACCPLISWFINFTNFRSSRVVLSSL